MRNIAPRSVRFIRKYIESNTTDNVRYNPESEFKRLYFRYWGESVERFPLFDKIRTIFAEENLKLISQHDTMKSEFYGNEKIDAHLGYFGYTVYSNNKDRIVHLVRKIEEVVKMHPYRPSEHNLPGGTRTWW